MLEGVRIFIVVSGIFILVAFLLTLFSADALIMLLSFFGLSLIYILFIGYVTSEVNTYRLEAERLAQRNKELEVKNQELGLSLKEVSHILKQKIRLLDKKTKDLTSFHKDSDKSTSVLISMMDDLDEINKKLIEEESRRKDFLRNVAHELKTPMTVMQLNLERLANNASASEKESIDLISRSLSRFHRSVTSILHLSRLEAGIMQYNKKPISITTLVKHVIKDVGPLAKEKGLWLRNELPSLPKVNADPERIEEVLRNLVGNAIKFTQQGGITINGKKGKKFITIEISDTGLGIKKPYHEKIFDKFFQIESGLSRSQPGSGVGLSICKATIEAHGGELWVESKTGKGSKFIFTLPVTSK